MILKGVPNRVVNKKVRKPGGRHRIVPWFRFDSNGRAEIDETKVSKADLIKLRSKFKLATYEDMSYQELKKLCGYFR